MDLHSVEQIEIAALGGADTITVNDLTGTGVRQVAIDLAASGRRGDGQTDTVIVNGTGGNDRINIAISGAAVVVRGLSAQVTIDRAEASDDSSSSTASMATTASMLPRSMPVISTS